MIPADIPRRWSDPLPIPASPSRGFPRKIAADRDRVAAVLRAHGLEAMICLRSHNVAYFTNVTPVLSAFKVEYPAFAVAPADPQQPSVYVGSMGSTWGFGYDGAEKPQAVVALSFAENWEDYLSADEALMRQEPRSAGRNARFAVDEDLALTERETWWRTAQETYNPLSVAGPAWGLVRALKDAGVTRGKVGADDMRIAYLLASIGFDAVTIVPADNVMRQIRMVKSDYEVELMRIAQQGTQDAVMAATKALKVGMTYDDFRRQFFTEAQARDCDPGFLLLGVTQGLLPDPTVTEGRCYMLDCSTSFRSYMGDFARTISIGPPSDITLQRFNAQQAGREAGLDAVRPGATRNHIQDVARAAMIKAGMPEAMVAAVNLHSVGMEHGDEPGGATPYAPGPDYTLRPNMTLTLDVPFMEIGWGSGHNEDMIRITSDGFEFLNSTSDPLIIV